MTRPQFAPRHPAPTPDDIRAARDAAGLTLKASAGLVHVDLRSWQRWEAGDREMPGAAWDLYRLRTRQITVDELD